MKNLKQLNASLENLNLDAKAKDRLRKIALVCNNIPVLDAVNMVAEKINKQEYGEETFYDKNDIFIKHEVSKGKDNNSNTTNSISFKTEYKTPLTKGLQYYEVSDISINNLNDKNVSVTYNNNKIYTYGQNILSTKEAEFAFNKNDELMNAEVVSSMSGGKSPSRITKTYSEQQLSTMLDREAHSSANTTLDRIL